MIHISFGPQNVQILGHHDANNAILQILSYLRQFKFGQKSHKKSFQFSVKKIQYSKIQSVIFRNNGEIFGLRGFLHYECVALELARQKNQLVAQKCMSWGLYDKNTKCDPYSGPLYLFRNLAHFQSLEIKQPVEFEIGRAHV